MALQYISHDVAAFPTPFGSRDVYQPSFYRRVGYPYSTYPGHQLSLYDDLGRREDVLPPLEDPRLDNHGDLGWSLEYATAWCYRHLVTSAPMIADAINHVRDADLAWDTPYRIFDRLDQNLFGCKLRDMIFLRWGHHPSINAGTTYAPSVTGIPRICIELNSAPFMDYDDCDIDDLLEALIHQMIHAYFLVCCGAQKRGEKQDGRLMDGVHFGIILLVIRQITKDCAEGPLRLVFHASKRQGESHEPYDGMSPFAAAVVQDILAISPHGCGVGNAPADGKTNCLRDNRMIGWPQVKNWQVNHYSRALDLDMESKGDYVYEFEADDRLTKVHRLKAPASVTYAELIWERKNVMVSREKALRFKSIEWPLQKYGRYELEIPNTCDAETFACIYNFINKGCYPGCEAIVWDPLAQRELLVPAKGGPPIYIHTAMEGLQVPGMIKHIKVFKIAEKLKFEELLHYSMARLWEMPKTTDDPITALRLLYDVHGDAPSGPIHSELHKWVRAFLIKSDAKLRLQGVPAGGGLLGQGRELQTMRLGLQGRSSPNLYTIALTHIEEIRALRDRSRAFKDDLDLIQAKLLQDAYTIESLDEDDDEDDEADGNPLAQLAGMQGQGILGMQFNPALQAQQQLLGAGAGGGGGGVRDALMLNALLGRGGGRRRRTRWPVGGAGAAGNGGAGNGMNWWNMGQGNLGI